MKNKPTIGTTTTEKKFYEAWYFIAQHPKFMDENSFETFPYGLYIQPVLVNPKTLSIDDDEAKNTKLQIWLEHGGYEKYEINGEKYNEPTHDIRLDCGADTFEEAIIELARLIKKYYK